MFILQILRFFLGYVRFEVTGGFKERFFNLVRQTGARVWELKKSDSIMEGYVIAADFKRLIPAAKKAGCKLHIKKRLGLPFIIRPYRKRWGLPIGALAAAALLFYLSSGVWSIKISGNSDVSRREIMDVLAQNGLTYGSFTNSIDEIDLSGRVLISLPELSYMSIYLNGCIAEVTVRESEDGTGILDRQSPCNLLSNKKGKIISLQVYDGDEAVEVGDYVEEGQLLISGVIERKLDNKLTHARGKVIAETEYKIEVSQPMNYTARLLSGEDYRRRSLRFFSLEIPLYIGRISDEHTLYRFSRNLNLGGVEMPIGVSTEIFEGWSTETVYLSEKQAEKLCNIKLKLQEMSLFSAENIAEKKTEWSKNESEITLKTTYRVREEIGIESPIEVDSSEDNNEDQQ